MMNYFNEKWGTWKDNLAYYIYISRVAIDYPDDVLDSSMFVLSEIDHGFNAMSDQSKTVKLVFATLMLSTQNSGLSAKTQNNMSKYIDMSYLWTVVSVS